MAISEHRYVVKNIDLLRSWPSWPAFTLTEEEAVAKVVRSNQLFASKEVKNFESLFSKYIGTEFAIGVGNATQGLHLALAASQIGEGDEVIVTVCSWISTASCILMQNAVPVFIDIESETFGVDPSKIEAAITPKTKAIIAVHILGYPSKIDEIKAIATKYGLLLIEDASHAPGAELDGKKMGTFGDLSVFSLHQRKAISTGDGGIICTNNQYLAEKIRKLRSFGDSELSYNYRMTEFSAVLGQVGLSKLDSDNLKREKCAKVLESIFADERWIRVRMSRPNTKSVYYAVALEINLCDRMASKVLNHFLNLGVPMRQIFEPLNRHPHFASNPKPARGLPWNNPSYNGSMKGVDYSSLNFPIAYEYCQGRVLELYTHPGTSNTHLEVFANELKVLYENLSSGHQREKWE